MNCKKCASMMSDYLDDALEGHVRLDFEIHLQECRQCAEELESTKSMLTSLSLLRTGKIPQDCWQQVRDKIYEQHPDVKTNSQLFRWAYAVPVVAIAIVLIFFLASPGHIGEKPVGNTVAIPEYSNYISAHSRAQRQQVLGDPHITFIAVELEKASLTTDYVQP